MDKERMSEVLKGIKDNLPTWFKMRQKGSQGEQFLKIMAMTYTDIEEMMDYAYYNHFLPTADVGQADIVYKAPLPAGLRTSYKLKVKSYQYDLEKAPNLEQFLTALKTDKLNHREVYYENPYYIDYEQSLIYVRRGYDIDETYKEGKLTLEIYDESLRLLLSETLKLQIHHVWNFFDEFGLLLDTPRLYGEKNEAYKERLLDVFRHPGNSSEQGLYNALARELGLTRKKVWKDASEDLVLPDARIRMSSIEVDGQKWNEELTYIDESNRVILRGDISREGEEAVVTYTCGLSMFELYNEKDLAFQAELFDIDGHATAMLQYYVDIINNKVPVNWNHFVWGVGYWDIANPEMSGYGVIPTFYDAHISTWTKYKKQE